MKIMHYFWRSIGRISLGCWLERCKRRDGEGNVDLLPAMVRFAVIPPLTTIKASVVDYESHPWQMWVSITAACALKVVDTDWVPRVDAHRSCPRRAMSNLCNKRPVIAVSSRANRTPRFTALQLSRSQSI